MPLQISISKFTGGHGDEREQPSEWTEISIGEIFANGRNRVWLTSDLASVGFACLGDVQVWTGNKLIATGKNSVSINNAVVIEQKTDEATITFNQPTEMEFRINEAEITRGEYKITVRE